MVTIPNWMKPATEAVAASRSQLSPEQTVQMRFLAYCDEQSKAWDALQKGEQYKKTKKVKGAEKDVKFRPCWTQRDEKTYNVILRSGPKPLILDPKFPMGFDVPKDKVGATIKFWHDAVQAEAETPKHEGPVTSILLAARSKGRPGKKADKK